MAGWQFARARQECAASTGKVGKGVPWERIQSQPHSRQFQTSTLVGGYNGTTLCKATEYRGPELERHRASWSPGRSSPNVVTGQRPAALAPESPGGLRSSSRIAASFPRHDHWLCPSASPLFLAGANDFCFSMPSAGEVIHPDVVLCGAILGRSRFLDIFAVPAGNVRQSLSGCMAAVEMRR
jgi:hypothetical protein